ncbi:CARDB domain-containing protein, partial [Kineococcus aurantiacus]
TAHAATAKPDLVVTKVTWAPQSVAVGQQLAFTATIKNQGNAPTPSGVIHGIGFQVDGKLRTWSDLSTSPLAPGETRTLTANSGPTGSRTWTATLGGHEILAYVDDAGRIAESNESNNRTKTTFTVTAKPTLTTTLVGASSYSTFPAMPVKTGVASAISGSGYGSCFTDTGAVPGTETYLGEYSAGPGNYYTGGPFNYSGLAEVPAGATSATSVPVSLTEIRKWHYPDPGLKITCADGQYPGFSKLHVTRVTTSRWTLNDGGWSGVTQLATATAVANADLPM